MAAAGTSALLGQVAVAGVVLIRLPPAEAPPRGNQWTLSGKVVDEHLNPVAGATIELLEYLILSVDSKQTTVGLVDPLFAPTTDGNGHWGTVVHGAAWWTKQYLEGANMGLIRKNGVTIPILASQSSAPELEGITYGKGQNYGLNQPSGGEDYNTRVPKFGQVDIGTVQVKASVVPV